MINKQIKKIYSIQNSTDISSLIEIETIILNGLYRFSILGINQKNGGDMKDRIYSALRSQKLLNLKSDNKKITVNILPTNIDKKDNFYDLPIALSCLVHTKQIMFEGNILAIGELSIVGNMTPSGYMLKAIYHAIENNINTIVCSHKDLKVLNIMHNCYDIIKENNIKFFCADKLSDLVYNIKEKINHTFENINNLVISDSDNTEQSIDINDQNIFKIVLAICTGRNVFIENQKGSYIEKFIKNIIYYGKRLDNIDILKMSYNLQETDGEILSKYSYPKVSFIDKMSQKDLIQTNLKESLFGFNIIDDFISINEEIIHIIKTQSVSSVLCFYNPCPCGNNNIIFSGFDGDRCLCLQRNILRYKQKIRRLENNFFDFYIKDIPVFKIEYTDIDYININNLISRFKKIKIEILQNREMEDLIPDYEKYDRKELDQIIDLSKDIAKLQYILNKNKTTLLSRSSVDLAIDFIKKDF